MGSKLKVSGWIAIGVVAGALGAIQLQAIARNSVAQLPLEELQQLAAVFGMIKSDYVEPVDEKKLINDAIAGMVSGLDPHSQYFDKKTFKEFREGTTGKFVGVGIEIGMEDGLVKVISPIEGTPAYRAGLKSGDLITKIDDTLVKGLTLDQAVKKMRGDPNTKVTLTIFRKAESRSFPVTITREEIRQQSVRAKFVEPGYAWIRLSIFQDRTVDDFARKIEELYKQDPNIKGIVLDLRNDPGGLLEGAVAIASAFLPSDAVVVTTNGQIADSKSTLKASPEYYMRRGGTDPLKRLPEAIKRVPLIVLVNEGSASASEIVAGALQDHKRATVIGAPTFGKGSVQTILPIGNSAGLKLTTARYYTPSGRSIQAKGIEPDIAVDDGRDSPNRIREANLDRHLETNRAAKGGTAPDSASAPASVPAAPATPKPSTPATTPQRFEFGSSDDFQLRQALNHLKGEPVIASNRAVAATNTQPTRVAPARP